MLRRHFFPALMISFVAILSSCSKEGPTGPTGPAGPSFTGAISGHVSLYDQYGDKVLSGLSSVQLSLNGAAATSPDANGYYLYPATTGDYSITAIASGYAATRANTFQFLADTLNRDIKLSAIPSFAPTAIAAYLAVGPIAGDSLVINFDADTRARNCIIFLNNSPTVNNLPANYMLAYSKAIPANATRVVIGVPAQDLYNAGFASGSTTYYAAYGYVAGDVSVYEDLVTGKNVYNAVSTSSMPVSSTTP